MQRARVQLVLIAWLVQLVALPGWAQDATPVSVPGGTVSAPPTALLRSVRVLLEPEHPAIEITASRPITPAIKVLEKPLRLVIDLDDSLVSDSKWIRVNSKQVSGMRVSQFRTNPPVVRIVLDLLKPAGYTWKTEGDVLTVKLGPKSLTPAQKPPVPALAKETKPALIAPVPGTAGAVEESASHAGGGSSVYAGSDTAIVHLPRGGEVRVCPGTTISVNYSKNGQDMMLGMSTGALELHYRLTNSNDAVVTPDFRIMLPGPGEFDYAISADSRGNTCVRTLPGNTAPAVVAELMGDGIYDVKPTQQVTFHSGRLISIASTVPPDCGCPEPGAEVMRASNQEPAAPPPAAAAPQPAAGTQLAANMPVTAPLPDAKPSDVHVQVEAPFVFRGDQAPPATTPPAKADNDPSPMVYAQKPEPMEVMITPDQPPAPAKDDNHQKPEKKKPAEHKGFFGKLKGIFSGMFH